MMLHDVHQGIVGSRPRKRVGRGIGSGHGKTSGRGHKGAGSRSGYKRSFGFEGGQMPLLRRIAKRGFNNSYFAPVVAEVNVAALEAAFDAGTAVTPELLKEKGLAKGRFDEVKILGNGVLSKKLAVSAHRFSKSAEEKIRAAGGTATRIGGAGQSS
jgi:large subunit ribosomal protein L15